ncbi:MAG: TolC family protein [bacterium]
MFYQNVYLRNVSALVICLLLTIAVSPAQAQESNEQTLSLDDIYQLVRNQSPAVQASKKSMNAKKGAVEQASLRPNPKLKAEAENFGGNDQFRGDQSLEHKYVLSYMFETWDKRERRTDVARDGLKIARWKHRATLLDELTRARKAYYNVLAAQERLELRRELVSLAEDGLETVKQQVEAGKVSTLEQTKARVERSKASIALDRSQRKLASARQKLASIWGEDDLGGKRVTGSLEAPGDQSSDVDLDQNPILRAMQQRIDQLKSSVELAQARSVPNVSVGGGYKSKRTADNPEGSFIVNINVPLPLFDRNQGRIKQTKQQMKEAKKQYDSMQSKLKARLSDARETLKANREEVNGLREDVIPGAQEAYEASTEGFRAGKFDYLDVLDAQRTLFENRIQLIRSLKNYYQTQAEMERLTANVEFYQSLNFSWSDRNE